MSARAGGREVKRHECRAPDAEFSIYDMQRACFSYVLVAVEIYPSQRLFLESFSGVRISCEDFILKCFGSEYFPTFAVIDDIDDAHAALQNSTDFPALLDHVADVPI